MPYRLRLVFGLVSGALLVTACGNEPISPGPGPWDEAAEIPAVEPPAADAVAGFEALVTEGYVSCGIPFDLFTVGSGLLGDLADGPSLVDSDGNPLRTGKNAEVPYNWNVFTNDDGVDIASLNCLQCHAGEINGRLVIGLGNIVNDYTSDAVGTLGPSVIDLIPPGTPGADSLIELIERQQAISFQTTQPTVGTNPAVTLAVALASHRDASTLAWLDEPHTPLPQIRLPVDVPPWWRTAKKHSHFYNGMGRGDHRGTMILASMLCTDTNDEAAEIMDYFDDVFAYIRSIEPPAYPFEIDREVADLGREVFMTNCSGCHGTYGAIDAEETYPNLVVPLSVIETDGVYASYNENLDELQDWFGQTFYAQFSQIQIENESPLDGESFRGYTAPPLDGIWATAPYLHNGSVPTLAALLESDTRPVYWKRVDYDSTHYDTENIGWPYERLTYGQDGASDAERKFIYDTTIEGHSASGHLFADELGLSERLQLLEYLKTI